MYLEYFRLPVEREEGMIENRIAHNGNYIDNIYPCRLFPAKGLSELRFEKITVFYGGNGSGKSTLLNLIAQKLELNRIAPFNSGELFDEYSEKCSYELGYDDEGFPYRVPNGSRIITSDDIFDYMLTIRTNNNDISENKEIARDKWETLTHGEIMKLRGLEDYEKYKEQMLARKSSMTRREFIRRTAGKEVTLNSNGETALRYFEMKLKDDTLYCLDEPENSMSPKMQLDLVKMLEEMAHYCGCQFIIATHSPFLLAIENAKIYNLDAKPVSVQNWWELENVKIYYEFFKKHRDLFENEKA